jgi:hypothetical protein
MQMLATGQPYQINISSFTVKNQLPGNTADWMNIPGALAMVAQQQPPGQPSGLVIQIKSGTSIICGNTAATPIPQDNFTVRNYQTAQLVSYLGQCPTLQPGTYTICVQYYNRDKRPISREMCKDFVVMAENQTCSPPQNINPNRDKIFYDNDYRLPKTFTWTPLLPVSRTLITYRLTVWEIEEDQTNAQAIYNNASILEREVRGQTQYIAPVGFLEKRNAKYIWRVIALNDKGEPACKTAQSEPTVFYVKIKEDKPEDRLNTACGNGDFESSILDPTEWSAGYTTIASTNSTYTSAFNSSMQPPNGNPIDAPLGAGCGSSSQNHHVIVSVGADPNVPSLSRVPASSIPNNYALRLGNNCVNNGTEKISKRFTVTAADTMYRFMYALVFQAPHSLNQNPSLWVRVFDATNTPINGLVYLDPLTNAPMDRAVSDPANPYWQTYNGILYRDWACAKINLSSLVGQTITIEIITNDCAQGQHYGYGYFDNFCVGCANNPPSGDCCDAVINRLTNTVNVIPGDILKITEEFNITPTNIKYVTAEIISVEEAPIDTSCMQCNTKESWAYQFISHNTSAWNSGMAMNATPVNSNSYYPAKMVEWFCNQQGIIKFNFKIALPGTATGCKRKGKVCIRYRFTDTDCKTCERIYCYNFQTP